MNRWKLRLLRSLGFDVYVRGLYHEVLAREPTRDERDYQLGYIRLARPTSSIVKMLRAFMYSREAESALGPWLLCRSPAQTRRDEEPIVYVMGLGSNCYASSMLSRQRLKRFSGPFDWTFSNLPMVNHCLRDDFRTFLDKRYYAPVPPWKRRDGATFNLCNHEYYLNEFGVEHVFNHTDPNDDAGYAYLVRCVRRMRAVIQSPERKLFVCVTKGVPDLVKTLEALCTTLRAKAGRFEILVVEVREANPNAVLPGIARNAEITGAHLYSMQPTSSLGGTSFEDPLDEIPIARLIRRFPLAPKALERIDSAIS